jgi:pimeloyl-ACP methyl ester carboxylesterase
MRPIGPITLAVRDHRLILIPGLGADARLFTAQRAAFPQAQVIEWIPPRDDESFPAYAARLASTIPTDLPLVLVGMSMGGMFAVEVAQQLNARGVILIASCTSRRAINLAAYPLERLARPLPDHVITRLRGSGRWHRFAFGKLTPEQRELFEAMLADSPTSFLRWAGREILRWRGPKELTVPIRHIHGRRDRIIMPYRVRPHRWVNDGGHLLTITHPREVNEFIADALRRFGLAGA